MQANHATKTHKRINVALRALLALSLAPILSVVWLLLALLPLAVLCALLLSQQIGQICFSWTSCDVLHVYVRMCCQNA